MKPGFDREGFALVAALWATVLLSSVALSLALRQREDRFVVLNRADEMRATAAAEAGIAHARALLAWQSAEHDVGVFDAATLALTAGVHTSDTVRLGDSWYHLTFSDAGAFLNLNEADPRQLARLLLALRVDASEADRIAQTVADWRDADTARRARGAESADYLSAARARLPDDGPFQAVADLQYVMGVTPRLYRRAESFLTIQGRGLISIHAAPLEVLMALPGMTPEAAIVILRMRRDGERLDHLADLADLLSTAARREFLANFARLAGKAAIGSTDVLVEVVAGTVGGRVRVERAKVLVVVSGGVRTLRDGLR